MKTAKPSTRTATENESCKAMVGFLTLLLDYVVLLEVASCECFSATCCANTVSSVARRRSGSGSVSPSSSRARRIPRMWNRRPKYCDCDRVHGSETRSKRA
jgi:hypothetical protein